MFFAFEKLVVYQRAVSFADDICVLTDLFPARRRFLADQLNRAALSIAANIAEGNGRSTHRDRRQFFIVARGSLHECIPLLELASRQNLLADDAHEEFRTAVNDIARPLAGLIRRESEERKESGK